MMECDDLSPCLGSTAGDVVEVALTDEDEESVTFKEGHDIASGVLQILPEPPSREILDYETNCRPQLVALTEELPVIHEGDHLHWKHVGAWRDGIVTSVPVITRGQRLVDITFVRYSYTFPRFSVKEELICIDLVKDKLYRYEYGQFCHPPALVIQRARACHGQTGYNGLRNNNDDFCRWCKAGKHTYDLHDETISVPESFICQVPDDNDTFYMCVDNMDEIKLGHHIAWCAIDFDVDHEDSTEERADEWEHGIVLDINQVEFLCCNDGGSQSFDNDSFLRYKFRQVLYLRSHDHSVVLDRTGYRPSVDQSSPRSSKGFACWAKTGIPEGSESMETQFVVSSADEQERTDPNSKKKNVGEAGARSAATTAARVIEGAAAGTVVKQSSRVLVRGAAEGAAAAAAVGVEAVFLAVDVTLTYKSFSRKEISKDELQRNNIVSTVRSAGAAGASVGGGVAGAAIGSLIVPGIGTIVGGIVGGVIGGISGQVGGHYAGKGIAFVSRRPYDTLFVDSRLIQD